MAELHPLRSPGEPMSVAILLFDDVEVLDFSGPFEVFSVAAHVNPGSPSTFRVFTVAERPGPVTCRGGLRVIPDHTLADSPAVDVLIVPGGQGTRREVANASLIAWIARTASRAQLAASVCTGAFLLAGAGILGGRRVTTHWASLDRLAAQFPDIEVVRDRRWVDEERIVTSAGISAGIDMSLHLVERLAGAELAGATARQMEYTWTSDSSGR